MKELLFLLAERWVSIMVRAVLVIGPMGLVFWWLKPKWIAKFRIHQPREAKVLTREELPRSVISLTTYLIPTVILFVAYKYFGYTMMYTDIAEYGWGYFFLWMLMFALVIDTWFYWAHRWMHSNRFLIRVHNVHHRSYNPTPASSYSFHIIEALINMSPYIFFLLLVPWHPLALFIYGIFGLFYVGYVHLGYDFGYKFRMKNPVLKWFYSSTHHSVHHQLYDGNFAVYFTFWDKLMGTEKEISPKN